MAAVKRVTRSSAASSETEAEVKPRQQDNVPGSARKRSAALNKSAEISGEELDVDAPPVAEAESTTKKEPVYTGKIPADFKGLPPFTLKQLRDSVPAHCFERPFWRSFSYVIFDGIALLAMYAGMWALSNSDGFKELPTMARWAAWGVWGWATGVFGTGWWVLAHECGHHSFSTNPALDNLVGYVLHTLLLVPYYSWQITHAKHHHHTGHMSKDQVFVPATRSDIGLPKPAGGVPLLSERQAMAAALLADDDSTEELKTVPIVHLAKILVMWMVGWPGYLLLNVASQPTKRWSSHFTPNSEIFEGVKNGKAKVVNSDIGIGFMLAAISYAGMTAGWGAVWTWYLMPWLWVNFWLVTITFLQHTHPSIPHYRAPTWTFTLGALATIDRSYGPLLNILFHHITDTHIAHHLFSQMPHYHAQEATEALKGVMGEWYMYSDEGVVKSVWKMWTECRFVEDEGDVLYFRK